MTAIKVARGRPAFALLDALVGVVLLATTAVSAVSASAASLRQLEAARDAEDAMQRADAFMHAVVLWPSNDLDLRLGTRPQGAWNLTISRPSVGFYVVELADTAAATPLLRTRLYRAAERADE